MARLGISNKDLEVPVHELVESTRALARVESAQILSKKFLQRDKVKQRMVENHERYLHRVGKTRLLPRIPTQSSSRILKRG